MTDVRATWGEQARPRGGGASCRCGARLTADEVAWGCTDCGADCCGDCASWLESTVYCPECTARLLAA